MLHHNIVFGPLRHFGNFGPLLDKMGCTVTEDVQMDQHHLMFKSFTKEFHTRPYKVTKRRCVLEQNISIGSHCME